MSEYYQIDSRKFKGDEALFIVTLLPEYYAYAGHFPGNPVSPGVCNIQMIKECAELLVGKRLFLAYIDKCKFLAVLTPQTTPQLQLRIKLVKTTETDSTRPSESRTQTPEAYKIRAALSDETTTYVDFKGEFVIPNS